MIFANLSETKGDIEELLATYKDLRIEQAAYKMLVDGVGEAEIRATLTKKGYVKADIEVAMATAQATREKNKDVTTTNILTAVTKRHTIALKAQAFAARAAKMAIGTIAFAVISAGLSYVVEKAYDAVKAKIQLAETTRDAAEEFDNEARSIEDYAAEYKELHDALLKAKGDEEETYIVKKQLFDLQTELNKIYGDECDYIDLVTSAYEDQTDAILTLSAAKAEQFIENNKDGIEDAEKAMTGTRTYQLGYGIENESEVGKEILKIAEEFNSINPVNFGGWFGLTDLEINTNALNSEKEISSFIDRIEELKEKYKNDPLIDSILGMSNASLERAKKEAKEASDKYGKTFKSNLEAEIVQNKDLYNEYKNAKNAIEMYNDAVLRSSDVYDDENVDLMYQNLVKVREELEASDDWERYSSIFEKIFEEASIESYKFAKGVNDKHSGLNLMANQLEGMTDIEFKAVAQKLTELDEAIKTGSEDAAHELENVYNKDAVDAVIAWGNQNELEIDQVANLLVQLGYLQSETFNSNDNKDPQTPARKMITQINSLCDGFEQLDKIMESIKDEDPFDYTLLDDKALDEFKSTGEAYDEFIETVSANPKDLKKCQDAFNNLVTEWVRGKAALNGVTDETAQLTINMLKNQGIVNAEEVVYAALAVEKAKVAAKTEDLSDITYEEIEALAEENNVVDEAKEYWCAYFAQKMLEEVYNGQGDIEELGRVVGALGVGTKAWLLYSQAIQNAANAQAGFYMADESADGITYEYRSAEQVKENWEAIKESAYKDLQEELQMHMKKGVSTNYGGGTKTNKDSGSDKDPKKEEIDWIERKKEILQRLHDIQEEIANDENESYQERVNALDYLIEKDKERIDAAKNAVDQYKQAWLDASKDLSDEDRKFIKEGGDIVKKYNSAELLKDGIVDSLEAGEEYIDNLKSAQDWYDKMIDSEKEELAHQKESIEHQKQKIQLVKDQIAFQQDLNDAITDQINSRKELAEVQGEYIGQAYYESLISQSKEQESLIKNRISALQDELDLTEEDSDARHKLLVEIENCKNELIQCQVEQAELNDTILRLPIERLQMFRDLYAQIIEDIDNYRSIQDKMGLNPTKEELQTYIDLYAESIDNTIEQQDKLKDLLKNYSYGSDKYKETMDEIQGLDNEISNLIASQIELNHQMLQIPVTEMSEEIDKLGRYKEALNNAIAEDNANGLRTTVDQYKDLHSITLQQLELYALQKAELTKLLDVYDENSQYYKDTEQQIADIDGQMSSLVQETYQWNEELLNIPIENLEKVNDNLSKYSSILSDVIQSYDEALEGVNALVDAEIEGIQDQLDLLNETNEARKIQLALEQAQYNLEKARNQKTTKVIRDGEVTYEANVDNLRSAQQELADAQYDKMVYDLEQQIERLEDIKEKWAEIIEEIEKAKDLQAAEDLFGDGWQDSVLADTDDLRDLFQSLYESTYNEKEAIDKQIVSNERIIEMMNELVSRYRDGSITYEEALSGINSMTDSADGNYTAMEMLNDMMSLDNISGLKDISEATQASVDETVGLLKQYMEIAESNRESVEHFETSLEGMSQKVAESVESFKESAESLQVYIDAYKANSEAINQYTKTWDEMKKLIAEQVEALKKAAEALEKQEKSSTSSSSSSSSSSNKSNNDDGGGTYYSAGGNSYHESTGTPAEIIGSYGTDKEKDNYRDYRESLIEAKREKNGEGWYEAAMKQLDEELKNAGVYHKGIEKGPVGFSPLSNDEIYSFAKRVAVNPLKADEVMAILQKGELVTQPEQMSNIMRNNQLIGQMAAEQANSAIRSINNVTRDNVVDFSIGEIHLHEVQNVDEFAKALSQTFASSMQQNFSKIFKH